MDASRTGWNSLKFRALNCQIAPSLSGSAHVVMEDGERWDAACIGGMLSMMEGTCHLLATTWEWKKDIDEQRASEAKHRAEKMLAKGGLTDKEYKIVKAKLQRALVRLSVKE